MPQSARVFRVFVSSTFSDLKLERDALHRHVFPKLRQLSIQGGARFQAIDLRWGVPDEAGFDQRTMKICLDEIARCRAVSPRPNFIVLLGERYGWRPLPFEIPAEQFMEIESRLPKDPSEQQSSRQLLESWYVRDDNAVPPVYCLRPRDGEIQHPAAWEPVERALRGILLQSTAAMSLSDSDRLLYETSATEQEIAAGVLTVDGAEEHVFCFFRSIRGMPESAAAREYIDLDSADRADSDSRNRLLGLQQRLRQRLPLNCDHFVAEWTGSAPEHISTDHIGELPAGFDDCVRLIDAEHVPDTLCVKVWRRLARVIRSEIANWSRGDSLEDEIRQHEAFGNDRLRFFTGRALALEGIAGYLNGSEPFPLVVCGESGSGMSAIIARAAHEARVREGREGIIVRYIGATLGSHNIRELLHGLCREIARRYRVQEDMPRHYEGLSSRFRWLLTLAKSHGRVVLFLDGLDQLSDGDHAPALEWLPLDLPGQVRMVVTSPKHGETWSRLHQQLAPTSFYGLDSLSRAEGSSLLDRRLDDAGRTLQDFQRAEVLGRFEGCGLPLYLELAFEEARRWQSFTRPVSLGNDIRSVIRENLLQRLSAPMNHGSVLVSRALSYLAAAKDGLSEDELVDLLTLDKVVFHDFRARAHHQPPEHRLPVVIWSRLFFEIEPYMVERSADGGSLLTFYHRQLLNTVAAEYLSNENGRKRHRRLAWYFANQALIHRPGGAANLRKLSELPYQQTMAEMWEKLHETLTSFEFIEAKCTHSAVSMGNDQDSSETAYRGVFELQEDYRRALQKIRQ